MWYYIYLTFFLLSGLGVARVNSAYHPALLMRGHITVRSPRLQGLLIMQSHPLDIKRDNRQEYRKKLTLLGLACYVLWLCLVVFSVLLLAFGPETPIEPFEFDEGFFVSTLKQAVIFMLTLDFLGLEIAFCFLNFVRAPFIKEHTANKVLWGVIVLAVFLLSVMGVVETVKLLL